MHEQGTRLTGDTSQVFLTHTIGLSCYSRTPRRVTLNTVLRILALSVLDEYELNTPL